MRSIYSSLFQRQSYRRMRIYLLTILAFLISGCSSTGQQANLDSTILKPWFCQSSSDDEEWDCVRSESLVRNPKTETIKLEQQQTQLAKKQISEGSQSIPKKTEPESLEIFTPTKSLKDSYSSDSPIYQRLAYRTKVPVPLLDLPKSFWAVQLIALSSKDDLEKYAMTSSLVGLSGARVASSGKLLYVLLLGIYETKDLAIQALASLPDNETMKLTPWARSVDSLHKAMISGDYLAGDRSY